MSNVSEPDPYNRRGIGCQRTLREPSMTHTCTTPDPCCDSETWIVPGGTVVVPANAGQVAYTLRHYSDATLTDGRRGGLTIRHDDDGAPAVTWYPSRHPGDEDWIRSELRAAREALTDAGYSVEVTDGGNLRVTGKTVELVDHRVTVLDADSFGRPTWWITCGASLVGWTVTDARRDVAQPLDQYCLSCGQTFPIHD